MLLNRNTLRALARRAGGYSSLADTLGLSPSTLYRWKKKGVPRRGKGRDALSRLVDSTHETSHFSPEFIDLIGLSEKYNKENLTAPLAKREPFKLPSKKSKIQKNREGRKTVAYINNKVWNIKLTPSNLLKLIWWYESNTKAIRNPKPVWQLGFTASSFSPFGNANMYEGRTGPVLWIHQLPHPQSDSFVILFTIASPRFSNKENAVKEISLRLEEELNTLPPKEVMIRTTFINNWRYRTSEEIQKRDTEKRYERKKKSSKK